MRLFEAFRAQLGKKHKEREQETALCWAADVRTGKSASRPPSSPLQQAQLCSRFRRPTLFSLNKTSPAVLSLLLRGGRRHGELRVIKIASQGFLPISSPNLPSPVGQMGGDRPFPRGAPGRHWPPCCRNSTACLACHGLPRARGWVPPGLGLTHLCVPRACHRA